jgi:hypothetical protein
MSMRIGGSYANWSVQNQTVNNWQQRQSGMRDVMKALQAGDLASAQKSFSSLNIDTSTMNSNSPMAKLSDALQSGDLAGAQQAAQGLGRRHHHDQLSSSSQSNGVQAAADPAFMQLVAQSLAATLSQNSQNANSGSAASNGTNNVTSANGPNTDATQALSAFMQNLMASLSGSAGTPGGPPPQFDADGDQDGSQGGFGFAQKLAGLSNNTSGTQSVLASMNSLQGPPSPRFNSFMQSMGGQIQNNLNNLLQQLSDTNGIASASSTTSTSSTAAALQSSFDNFISKLGGQASTSASLTSFLQNLEQNLQYGNSSGNLINLSA